MPKSKKYKTLETAARRGLKIANFLSRFLGLDALQSKSEAFNHKSRRLPLTKTKETEDFKAEDCGNR